VDWTPEQNYVANASRL